MKKLTTLLMICSLFVMTTIVFASNGKPGSENDGVKWTNGTISNDNTNDKTINRSDFTRDNNDIKDQVASVQIKAKAYIPCYLKLELTGNQGKTTAESFGPKAEAIGDVDGYEMVFDNEVGGFVDSNWKVRATGKNAEVSPYDGCNIAACDTFKVVVYSNDNFKYDVISAPLTGKNNAKLDLIMGYKNESATNYTNVTFTEKNKTVNIGTFDPCTTITEYHKFAVPYTGTTVQGEYSGTVTFKATTI